MYRQNCTKDNDIVNNGFYEMEQASQYAFEFGGPYWHLYTSGNLTEIIFRNRESFEFGMTFIALSSAEYKVSIITFAIMSNHIHVIIEGEEDECLRFFEKFKTRLKRYYSSQKVFVDFSKFNCSLTHIDDLKSIRNEIVYVNRNGYLANTNYSPVYLSLGMWLSLFQ